MRKYPTTVPLKEAPTMSGLKELLPPDVPPVQRWRLAVAGTIVLLFLIVGGSYGVFSKFGWMGFARASEIDEKIKPVVEKVDRLEGSVKELRLQQIEDGIFSAKESECTASDPVARRFFSARVLSLSREYFSLSGTSINIPPCRN